MENVYSLPVSSSGPMLYFWSHDPRRSNTHTGRPGSSCSFTLITCLSGKGPSSCQFPAAIPGTARQRPNYFLSTASYTCEDSSLLRAPSLSLHPASYSFLGKMVWLKQGLCQEAVFFVWNPDRMVRSPMWNLPSQMRTSKGLAASA